MENENKDATDSDDTDDGQIELLPHIRMQLSNLQRNACAYFQRQLLGPLVERPGQRDNESQRTTALWKAIMGVRVLWMRRVTEFSNAGLGGAGASTWNTRMNCRPVIATVTPTSKACGFVRICPFCYARKCWSEYYNLRMKIFPPRPVAENAPASDQIRPISKWQLTAVTRRYHYYAADVPQLEDLIRSAATTLRRAQNRDKTLTKLAQLRGWFRTVKLWVTPRKVGGFRLCIETMVLGASLGDKDVPVSLFIGANVDPPEASATGLVFERTWTRRQMSLQAFRKFMLRTMRYKPEWLSNDMEVAMAYNRALMDMRFQQFYCGGVFRQLEELQPDEDQTTTE